LNIGGLKFHYTYQHGNQGLFFLFLKNQFSNNPLNCMKTFTYQGFPKFGTNILVGKKGKKPF
jgi:hypothetical protein